MPLHTTFRLAGKSFLLAVLCLVALAPTASSQTFTYNHSIGGQQLWNLGANWVQNSPPSATDYAYIAGNQPGFNDNSLFITNASTLTSANAAVGTLIITAPLGNPYSAGVAKIRSSNNAGRNATITFGNASTPAALKIVPSDSTDTVFELGTGAATGDGSLTIAVPAGLALGLNGDGPSGRC